MAHRTSRSLRLLGALAALLMLLAGLPGLARPIQAASSISLATPGVPYTQDFDTLASSGTSSTLPQGWDFSESGTRANSTYTAGAGSSITGDTYSFGAAASPERAFGGLQSG